MRADDSSASAVAFFILKTSDNGGKVLMRGHIIQIFSSTFSSLSNNSTFYFKSQNIIELIIRFEVFT
jgi:hypothetical protein